MAVEIEKLKMYIETNYGKPQYVYLDLYIKKVKLVVYSSDFNQYIETQIPYVIYKDAFSTVDASIVLWKEKDELAPDIISEYDAKTNTYYYGVKNLEYEEFIKQGHFLVHTLYKILKTDKSSLVHGAAVGINGEGILICAKGQRGKSTLTVLSMFRGMEYVSDDYLLLNQNYDDQIIASPIYSIITLSPVMADKLGSDLNQAVKLGWNARKDKYIFNISCMHNSFKENYPIKAIMFPEIQDIDDPYIRSATSVEKNRAISQLVQSTMMQMNDTKDPAATIKLINMVNKYDCFYIGLSHDIEKNAKLLKEFMESKGYKQ